MTTRRPAARGFAITVALLTVAWVFTMLTLMWWWFSIGMEGWADHHSNSGQRSAELGRKARLATVLMLLAAPAGPVLISVVAFAGRLFRTGVLYLVPGVAIGVALLPVAVDIHR